MHCHMTTNNRKKKQVETMIVTVGMCLTGSESMVVF